MKYIYVHMKPILYIYDMYTGYITYVHWIHLCTDNGTVNYSHLESQFCSSKLFTSAEVKAVPRRPDPVEVLNQNPASTRCLVASG